MPTGFFTDTTICIGCKACEVACKQWNNLPSDGYRFTGESYDNTSALHGTTWRHVAFIEDATPPPTPSVPASASAGCGSDCGCASTAPEVPIVTAWRMMSDVCKHCTNAGCHEACPTGAIIRNEFGNIYIQPDVCNGCGYCVPSCPFGVVELIEPMPYRASKFVSDGRGDDDALQKHGGVAGKCTLCYDRQKVGETPACAKACPTQSIQFGDVDELRERAERRVAALQAGGAPAYLYGAGDGEESANGVGPLNAFFLLTAPPATYNLPERPVLPSTHQRAGYASGAIAAAALALVGFALFRRPAA